MFWPLEKKEATKRKTTQKIPSVATSEDWQEYSAQVEAEKLCKQTETEERKRQSQEVAIKKKEKKEEEKERKKGRKKQKRKEDFA